MLQRLATFRIPKTLNSKSELFLLEFNVAKYTHLCSNCCMFIACYAVPITMGYVVLKCCIMLPMYSADLCHSQITHYLFTSKNSKIV
jgi:hypothetical protein